MGLRNYVQLMRPWQWYKNLLVFLAVIFVDIPHEWPWDKTPAIFQWHYYPPLILGFIALCAVSSAGYIINDIKDIERDAAHPEKRNRPLPSGEVSKNTALAFALILMIGGLTLAYALDTVFLMLVILYIINSQLYNLFLRKWAVIDVITIAVGFIIRAIAGTFLIHVPFTSWLVIGVFFFALVLGFGKRKNELQLLGEDAAIHKPVFQQYTETMLDHGITMSATWVLFFYTFYCYENFKDVMQAQPVLLTVPVVAGILLRYVYLVFAGSPVGRNPHLALRDKGIALGVIIYGITLLWTVFFWQPIFEFFYDLFPPLFPP